MFAIAAVLALITTGVAGGTDGPLEPAINLTTNAGAFEFNGLDSTLNLGHSSITNASTGDLTVHVWVQFASLTDGGPPCFEPGCDMSIVDKMSPVAAEVNGNGWRLLKQSDDHFWFCIGGESETNGCGPESTTVRSTTLTEAGVWYSVTAVKSATELSMYVNGVPEATTSLGTFTNTNTADLLIGSNAAEGAFLNGRIRQVEIFDRALSSAHVRVLFERSKLTAR